MSWLDQFFAGVTTVLVNGVQQPYEGAVNLVPGTNVTITAVDLPNAVPPQTQITVATGAGLSVVQSTTATPPQLTAATWQLVEVDSSGGAFTLPLPTSGLAGGQIVWLKDVAATSATTGIFANQVTISGGTNPVQNQHTMVVSATSYAWGAASQDGGGNMLGLYWSATKSAWMVIA